MKEFKIGDKVKIKETSEHYSLTSLYNPANTKGVIFSIRHTRYTTRYNYEVNWENGQKNNYSFEDLELYDDFVLPNKWFIRNTPENSDYITKYRKLICEFPYNTTLSVIHEVAEYTGGTNFYGNSTVSSEIKGIIEITLEQFRKYVLKEDIEVISDIKQSLDHKDGYYTLEEVESAIKEVLMEDEVKDILELLKNKQLKTIKYV